MNKRICDYCGGMPYKTVLLTNRPNDEDTYAELCFQCMTDIVEVF